VTGPVIRTVGRRGLLADATDPPAAALRLAAAARRSGLRLEENVPGAATLLAVAAHAADLTALRAALVEAVAVPAGAGPGRTRRSGVPGRDAGDGGHQGLGEAEPDGDGQLPAPGGVVEIPVRYDGADLATVASLTGLSVGEVVAAHAGGDYRGAFCGFAPGFCYLTGLPAVLQLPRRREPRPAVPAGAVAIADCYSAVYPRATPGGWHLLGTSGVAVWETARRPPALVTPGTPVRFRPLR